MNLYSILDLEIIPGVAPPPALVDRTEAQAHDTRKAELPAVTGGGEEPVW